MGINLRGKFLKLLDFTTEEVRYLLDLSKDFKSMKRAGTEHKYLSGRNMVLLFEKTSTRTRCSFEVAGNDLGLGVTYLEPGTSQMGKKESIKDTARVLGRMYDCIEYRGFSQKTVEELAEYSGVPVFNGLTDEFHPTQMLADLLTIEEHFGYLKGLNFIYAGDARNNVANSLMIACAKMGLNFTAASPKELFPSEELVKEAKKIAEITGSKITLESDPMKATKDANIIYTDIWVSMGEPDEIWEQRINQLKAYQVNQKMIDNAAEDVIFLHCLPSFHDRNTTIGEDIYKKFGIGEMEVTDEVFESHRSLVFDQAENRMHTIKAVVYAFTK